MLCSDLALLRTNTELRFGRGGGAGGGGGGGGGGGRTRGIACEAGTGDCLVLDEGSW